MSRNLRSDPGRGVRQRSDCPIGSGGRPREEKRWPQRVRRTPERADRHTSSPPRSSTSPTRCTSTRRRCRGWPAFFYAPGGRGAQPRDDDGPYLLDADAQVTIPGVAAPETDFADLVAPVALALEQERRVSEQVADAGRRRARGGRLPREQFVQWFLKEQVEEVATMSALLAVVERSGDTLTSWRTTSPASTAASAADPTAPRRPPAERLGSSVSSRSRGAGSARRRGGSSASRSQSARAAPARTCARCRARCVAAQA